MGQFVVEYRRECLDRPVVVAVPPSLAHQEEKMQELRDMQLLPKTHASAA